MSRKPFIPPPTYVEYPSQEAVATLKNMTKKEHRKIRKSKAYRKYVQPGIDRQKLRKDRLEKNGGGARALLFSIPFLR